MCTPGTRDYRLDRIAQLSKMNAGGNTVKRTTNKKRLELTKQKVKDLTVKDLESVAGGKIIDPNVQPEGIFSGDACISAS